MSDKETKKPIFIADAKNERKDPLAPSEIAGFDFEQIYRDLDGEKTPEEIELEYKRLIQALRAVMAWIIPADKTGEKAIITAGRRVIAFQWVMNPEFFNGGNELEEKSSGTKVGNNYGLHKAVFSELTSECSKKFGVRNKYQSHGWNFKEGENQ